MINFFEDNDGKDEPSFSLSDFKKWLSHQKKKMRASKKEELKEKFKNKIKEKIKKRRDSSEETS